MARRIIVLGLILFVIIGIASAAKPAEHSDDIGEVADPPSGEVADGPSDDIGTTDANDDAAPVGGPVPAGAFPKSSTDAQSTTTGSSAASALDVSTIAGLAATAAGAVFFF